jgi:hypothetical protein
MTGCKVLSVHLQKLINIIGIELFRWTPAYGSVTTKDSQMVHLTIKGMPCNLNTPTVFEYMLRPFSLEMHISPKEMTTRSPGNTMVSHE